MAPGWRAAPRSGCRAPPRSDQVHRLQAGPRPPDPGGRGAAARSARPPTSSRAPPAPARRSGARAAGWSRTTSPPTPRPSARPTSRPTSASTGRGCARCWRGSARCPAAPGYVTRTFCEQARFFSAENGARIDAIRDAIAQAGAPEPLRGCLLTSLLEAADRVELDLRPADGLPQAPCPALAQAAGAARAGPGRGPARRGHPARRQRAGPRARRGRLRLPRPAVQRPLLLLELPRLGDPGALGPPAGLRRGPQARRLPHHAQRLQPRRARRGRPCRTSSAR